MTWQLGFTNGSAVPWPLGKVVCVGRNYAEHARELNNPVPKKPLLFIKPASSVVPFSRPVCWPSGKGGCHYEAELAVLVGETLSSADQSACLQAIAGYGVALDLTFRTLQSELKSKGHPWELAKAFDGACPVTEMVPAAEIDSNQPIHYELSLNGELRQQGMSDQMIMPLAPLLSYVSHHFTLSPGDIVLTGTPAGVGELHPEDRLKVSLMAQWQSETWVKGELD